MRDSRPNPFQTEYLTEALTDPELYWDLFSPEILTGEAQRLFREGNVVLLGSNGTGKTMLLRLFAPEVQAAFLRGGREIPIPPQSRQFLSMGINFVVDGVGALGKRSISSDPAQNLLLWSLLLGDFLNYFLVGKLLEKLEFLASPAGKELARFLNANTDPTGLESYAEWLAGRDCWFGYLDGIGSFHALTAAIRGRLLAYRSYVNFNSNKLPEVVQSTKTEIGAPLLDARNGLIECGILLPSVPLMVTIDQYETLFHIDYETKGDQEDSIGRAFCRVVNSFLARRNPSVSCKVGTRPYSWNREMRPFGTDARIELGRDYQEVHLDRILQRREDQSSWIFPQFARDVAKRRMARALGGNPEAYSWPETALAALGPEEEVNRYSPSDSKKLLHLREEWPEAWGVYLRELYASSRFEAKLAEVWLLQYESRNGALPDVPSANSEDDLPWRREYWQKERREALLTQIASMCSQRRLYAGWDTVLTLSGTNILVFLSLCREIWDVNERIKTRKQSESDEIGIEAQTHAIRLVAENWLNKQLDFSGGARRQKFIIRLGIGIRKAILADATISYPGHNGFSLLIEEYESAAGKGVRDFLENATDFGALVASHHTTKERDRKPRKKWYIFPILCPNFDIPAIRTKEPYYTNLREVSSWLVNEREPIELRGRRGKRGRGAAWLRSAQPDLFVVDEDEANDED